MNRTFALSAYTRRRFGERVLKIPLDAGFSCPNRDGALSRAGCLFCNPRGSGSDLLRSGLSLAEQWTFWRDIHRGKHGVRLFTAYLQSFSNTHGPIEKLAATLDRIAGLPGLAALSIGTRPDCLDPAKLDLLADQRRRLGLTDIFLELGLQSASDATLAHINRGHTVADFTAATQAAADRGLLVVAHVMAGLPTPIDATHPEGRETGDDLLRTVTLLNTLPIHGVKFHNTYVCKNTPLAHQHAQGRYTPLTLAQYLAQLAAALLHLKPTVVVHRLNANPATGELVAPDWAGNMRRLHNQVRDYLEANDVWQGKRNGAESGVPEWFTAE
ncbi:MAG: TIGR01212 family radical SAM protein [Pseudodesulfovibrio sp.]